MKKLLALLSLSLLSFNTYASVTLAERDGVVKGDFVGKIVAAYSFVEHDSQVIRIISDPDSKNDISGLPSLVVDFKDKDLLMGQVFANSVGKKIAVYLRPGEVLKVPNLEIDVSGILIITDEYWNGSSKARMKNK